MSEDFLSRWSRRKLGTGEAARPELPSGRAAEPATEIEITPEELAALPPIETLTAETDIGAFLRKGVPTLLRNAALRRVWSLDPAIRDFVNDAREYAYDWNVPGGVPGNGPMLPTDDVAAMVGRIFGDLPTGVAPETEAGRDTAASAGRAAEPISEQDEAPDDAIASAALPEFPPSSEPVAAATAEPMPAAPDLPVPPRLRRHGGAIPV